MKLKKEKISSLFEDIPVYFYETIDSTNTRAVEILKETDCDRFVVIANEQANGKGRSGKSFFSPKDTGVYFSVVIHSDCGVSDIVGLTPMVAVAVVNSIEKLANSKPKIKWVNDIYLDDKKICGILVQSVGNAYVIGIGINITTIEFPEEISKSAGSLGIDIDSNLLVNEISRRIFEMSKKLTEREFIKEYREKSYILGKEINYFINGVAFDGTAVDIDELGGLVVEKNGIKKVLTSGEITVRTK